MPTRRGKHARAGAPAGPGVPGDAASGIDVGLIDRMLVELAAQSPQPLGRFAGRLDTPAKKMGFMVGGTAVAGLVILLLMALAGALL